ncbi:aspartic proteinase precursor [Scheffersomyces amazonensis]|uniref:aspartic proteinase precursor n=1 Tax=Scheffersomyces amazonensis TaxID=1078765 RepID=UPI00315CF1C9
MMSNNSNPSVTQQQEPNRSQPQLQSSQLIKRSARDYQFGQKIGEGSYSSVYSAVDVHNGKTYAIKVLSKQYIVKEDKIKYVNIEKTTLHRLGLQHPGIVQLYYTFQDEASLFFVLDFAEYGELLSIIRKFGSLSEPVSKFYMCQIVDAVRFIHSKGVIHRDLKPENILVAHDFSLKITDFGAAKLLGSSDDPNDEAIDYNSVNQTNGDTAVTTNQDRKGSFVGTAEYVSPELLKHNICGFESDVWAIGCILFQFFNGVPPFKGETEYLTFEKIINVNYNFAPGIPYPPEVVQLVKKILVADPASRLTIPQIMSDSWFSGVPWDDVSYIWYRKVPRFEPFINSNPNPNNIPTSNSNSAGNFTPIIKSGRNVNKSNSYQQLHNQIQNSDFNFVPSLAKKSYQPATKIKKNFLQPSPMPMPPPQPVGLAPKLNNINRIQPNYVIGPPPRPQQMYQNNNTNNSPKQPLSNSPSQREVPSTTINEDIQRSSPQSAAPESPSKTAQFNNLRNNTAFASIAASSSSTNVTKATSSAPKSSVPIAPKSTVPIAPKSAVPHAPVKKASPPVSVRPKPKPITSASAAAAAAAGGSSKSVMTQTSQATPKPSQAEKVVTKPSKPNPNPSTSPVSLPKELSGNVIKFREISNLLEQNEKILKLDTILKSQLSNKVLNRNLSVPLDDVLIDQLVTQNSYNLERHAIPVVTIITNLARVFFIDRSLNVMLVDLKANQGADYSMYDYEFESIAIDEDDQSVLGEDVFGYLILELIKEGGDLIFLKRISQLDRLSLNNPVKVVDKNGDEVKLGKNYGWIDCLLMAKEMVSKDIKEPSGVDRGASPVPAPTSASISTPTLTSTTTSAPAKPTTKSKTKTSAPKIKKTIQPSFGSSTAASSSPKQQQISKFAYAAAAAAHK